MSLKQLFLAAACTCLFACNQSKPFFISQYLNESKLQLQEFVINPNNDTTLVTRGGVKIKIETGTFTSNKNVTIEFKEALDFKTILEAGLMTTSNGNMLSSGGMIYIDTKEDLKFNKAITVEIPTNTALEEMQLFRGEMESGIINWDDPTPINQLVNDTLNLLGKSLFENNCRSCHLIERDMTAPALANVTGRWNKRWESLRDTFGKHLTDSDSAYYHNPLFEFTRNEFEYGHMFGEDIGYACCMINYSPAAMNQFPNLSDDDLAALYKYIDDETERLGLADYKPGHACDSCSSLTQEYYTLVQQRPKVQSTNGAAVLRKDTIPPVSAQISANVSTNSMIIPNQNNADYYQILVSAPGWFNIDILLEDRKNVSESKLFVSVSNYKADKMEVFLAIPSFKVLAPGGVLYDGRQVGFKDESGNLPLPQNANAIVFAVAEEQGVFYFAQKNFTTSTYKTIDLQVEQLDKATFERKLAGIGLSGINFEVAASLQSDSLRVIDAKLDSVATRMKSGSCGCLDSIVLK